MASWLIRAQARPIVHVTFIVISFFILEHLCMCCQRRYILHEHKGIYLRSDTGLGAVN